MYTILITLKKFILLLNSDIYFRFIFLIAGNILQFFYKQGILFLAEKYFSLYPDA